MHDSSKSRKCVTSDPWLPADEIHEFSFHDIYINIFTTWSSICSCILAIHTVTVANVLEPFQYGSSTVPVRFQYGSSTVLEHQKQQDSVKNQSQVGALMFQYGSRTVLERLRKASTSKVNSIVLASMPYLRTQPNLHSRLELEVANSAQGSPKIDYGVAVFATESSAMDGVEVVLLVEIYTIPDADRF